MHPPPLHTLPPLRTLPLVRSAYHLFQLLFEHFSDHARPDCSQSTSFDRCLRSSHWKLCQSLLDFWPFWNLASRFLQVAIDAAFPSGAAAWEDWFCWHRLWAVGEGVFWSSLLMDIDCWIELIWSGWWNCFQRKCFCCWLSVICRCISESYLVTALFSVICVHDCFVINLIDFLASLVWVE